jgi:lipopolysaccharide transport system permease protein
LPGVDKSFGYSIYLCSGILTWGLLAEITGRCQNVFLENANLLKKLHFPRLCLPIIVAGNAWVNFALSFGLFTVFLLLAGHFPGAAYFALAPLLLLLTSFSIGLGVTLGVLNVFFRDVGQFFGIFLSFWFWLTPIVYPASIVPKQFVQVIELNPLTPLIAAFQNILVHGTLPIWSTLLPFTAMAIALCWSGLFLFRKHAGEMVDEL